MLQANLFITRIENFKQKMELEKTTGEPIYSEPHVIKGYKMRLQVYLNGLFGQGKQLSLYFQLMKGRFDDCLDWPFTKTIEMTFLHPEKKATHKGILKSTINPDDIHSFGKPYFDANESIGYTEFIDHDSLHSKGFLKEDKLFIKCEIGQ